mgnify:CR=1 FL=1
MHVYVDVEAEESFVLQLGILTDHQEVFFRDQVRNDILDLFTRFNRFFNAGAAEVLNFHSLDHSVDDLELLNIILVVSLEFLHHFYNHHGQLLVLLVADFGLLAWLCSLFLLNRLLRNHCLVVILSQILLLQIDIFLHLLEFDVALINVDV